MLVVFPPIFVEDTKIIYGCNFVAPLNEVKASGLQLIFNILQYSSTWHIQKNEVYKTTYY